MHRKHTRGLTIEVTSRNWNEPISLAGNQGLGILSAGSPSSIPMNCTSGAVDGVEQTVTASNSSLTYDAVANQYIYTWKTDKAWASSCRQLTVTLNDGTSHTAFFTFTK